MKCISSECSGILEQKIGNACAHRHKKQERMRVMAMFCTKCGAQILEGATFCCKCGTVLTHDEIQNASVSDNGETVNLHPNASVTDSNIEKGRKNSTHIIGGVMEVCANFFIQIGRVAVPLVAIYVTVCAIFGFPYNKMIVGIGLLLGAIGVIMKVILSLLEKSKVLAYSILGVGAVAIVAIMVLIAKGQGNGILTGTTVEDTPQHYSNPVSDNDEIVIGETKSYDNNFGNMEVTLDYVQFADKRKDTWTGDYIYPDEDSVFLCAVVTVKNIGTKEGSLITAWNTVVYDGVYEFRQCGTEGDIKYIAPLSPAVTAMLIFMVPNSVVETDKSLVLNINNDAGEAVASYIVRPGEETDKDDLFREVELSGEDFVTYDAYDKESALQSMIDWFERFPLKHNIRIRFMEEAVDDGSGSGKYLKYELDMAETLDTAYEQYGIFYVNPDDGCVIMESITDDSGGLVSIQVPMAQWYLEYYWGCTDDSGYYSESYGNDLYGIYNDMNIPILEYHADDDSYVICDFDIVCFIEYDDSLMASGIGIGDFAGSYFCDLSAEVEGHYVEDGYMLDIGNMEYNTFSIEESWRGIDLLRDDYAQPRMLIENTLYFEIYNPESVDYEMHYLMYIPAEDSPVGKDVIYLDGDDTMPFEKE